MTLMTWLRDHFLPHRDAGEQVERAERATEILSRDARELGNVLESYTRKPDPFVAIVADMYTAQQLQRAHRGPS